MRHSPDELFKLISFCPRDSTGALWKTAAMRTGLNSHCVQPQRERILFWPFTSPWHHVKVQNQTFQTPNFACLLLAPKSCPYSPKTITKWQINSGVGCYSGYCNQSDFSYHKAPTWATLTKSPFKPLESLFALLGLLSFWTLQTPFKTTPPYPPVSSY